MDEILKLGVEELKTKICSGNVKSEDAVKACFKRIKEIDPEVKAFLKLNEEQALKLAAESDNKVKDGKKRGYLEGVPIAVKDNIMIKGESMTSASKYLENYVSPYDAAIIEKLKEAGAVFVGRTNMDEFAMGSSTETSAYAKTVNPWDTRRIPGGSSGGSAAAVAAGMVPFALGSDTGGSVRQPAGFCGVVGFKPSYGLVSRYGVCALASSFDQPGTLSKTVKDTAMLLTVIAGKDYRDPVCEPNENIDYTRDLDNPDTLKNTVIGVPKQLKEYQADSEVIKSYEDALKKLEKAGAKITEADIPSYRYAPAMYKVIMCAEVSANIATFDGIRYGWRAKNAKGLNDEYSKSRGESMGYEVKKRVIFGTYVLGSKNYHKYYNQAQKARTLLISELNEAYKKCDVIFSPAALQMPVKFGETLPEESDVFLVAANLAGLPGITVPGSFTDAGMPVGAHFMGRRLEDAKLLRIAAAYEKISGFDKEKFPFE